MNSFDLSEKFFAFFKERGHCLVPSSSLIPEDKTCLFTTAGMQQFKEYFLAKKSPFGKMVASLQKCFRTSDIESVGDKSHLTFLLMLGNFSFGDYFKKEAISWAFDFLFKELGLPKKDARVSVFGGDKEIPFDKESFSIWKKIGFLKEKIKKGGREDNFWGPTGLEGPCGPTTEIHMEGVELWNLVFNEYFQDKNKNLTPLKQKGVDTGMGLERLAMICQKKESVFETDLFWPVIEEIEKKSLDKYFKKPRFFRILADHLRASAFLITDGILPSNVERGYVLRRILRRSIRYGRLLNLPSRWYLGPLKKLFEIYGGVYPEILQKSSDIITVWQNEEEKFSRALNRGMGLFEKLFQKKIKPPHQKFGGGGKSRKEKTFSGEEAFDLYQNYGFPLELTEELARERGFGVDKNGFLKAFLKHREISRIGAESKFGGGGALSPSLHTATHLLHAALRQILGSEVKQMGSDITKERLRFDFSFPRKLRPEEIKKVEDLVNQKIKENLKVKKEEMSLQEALKIGALAFFKEKYPSRVSVYTILNPKTAEVFSREICAGPHVKETKDLGKFKIQKEESCQAGIRRIRARLEK